MKTLEEGKRYQFTIKEQFDIDTRDFFDETFTAVLLSVEDVTSGKVVIVQRDDEIKGRQSLYPERDIKEIKEV